MKWNAVVAGLVAVALTGCSGDGPSDPGNGGGNGPTVEVRNDFFAPATVAVAANTTVTWNWNSGGLPHDVTFDDGENSPTQGSGSYTRTFTTAGSFPYHCTVHGTAMSGVVNVTGG